MDHIAVSHRRIKPDACLLTKRLGDPRQHRRGYVRGILMLDNIGDITDLRTWCCN
jgi:hypothetical protein